MTKRMRFAVAIAAIWMMAVSGRAALAQDETLSVRPPKLDAKVFKLDNGLTVVLLDEHEVPMANVQVWYHVGSKDELAGHSGFAHLFEHLMFKGSAHVGPDEHSRIIEAMGGFDNAYTNDDATVFFETFPSNYLERVIWLEADRMGSLNVDEANFNSERQVVEEERRVRVDNQPYGLLSEDLYAAAFTVHPYHHTTIGSIADLDKATVEDVRKFHGTYYKPNNATMVIVGDFEDSQALSWARKYFDGIPASAGPIPRIAQPEPAQTEERVLNKSYANSPLPAVVIGYKMPARYAPDSYGLDLASNILAAGESSRLYQALVYKQRIAVEAGGFGNFTEDPNLFWAFAIMNQGHTADEGNKAVVAQLDEIKAKLVDAKELDKAKNQEIASFVLGRSRDQEKADALGAATVLGKDANLVNTELDRYLKENADDIERVARQYFVSERSTVLLIAAQAHEQTK
jgi:zinc protease